MRWPARARTAVAASASDPMATCTSRPATTTTPRCRRICRAWAARCCAWTATAAAGGNNTPAGGDARIFSYGHRNVQGIAFRPGTGRPFIAEHGPNHSDEVTALVAGGNGGWDPQNRPGLTCPDDYCGYAGNATTMPMTDTTRFPNAMQPSWNNTGRSQGTGPCTFLSGAQWKAWDGRLAVGIMGAKRLAILELDPSGMAVSAVDAKLPAERYRSLVQGPDGNLYIAAEAAGEIWRVVPN